MALQKEHGTQVVEDYFGKKESIHQEQTPSSFKSGEEMPIDRVNGLYRVQGVEGLFTSRIYAEQAYKEYLHSKVVPELDKEIKQVKKRARFGVANDKEVKKVEEKKQEWLETH